MISSESEWVIGRVRMLYRDLTPESLKSRVVVSHIRLPFDGEVPDYVHYHKVEFQMIYCKHGRIKVVYEDQGEPFWLETGDCVLQPPEIRHRALECTAGAEVIEVTMPAEHETWQEHDLALPTSDFRPARIFNGQRFVYHRAVDFTTGERDTGINDATDGAADVRIGSISGSDTKLLLSFRLLGTEIDGLLPAPITFEITI